jgi:uncharacterized protein
MKRAFNAVVAAIMLVLSFAALVAAGQFEDATAALQRGDYAAALRLLRPLADQGSVNAQVNLGGMYLSGQGVGQNFAEAAKWYRLAANQGNADGQNRLGTLYAVGRGVPKDYVIAYMWFSLSVAQRFKDAAKMRDDLAQYMTPEQIAEAQKRAREWKPTTRPTK